MSRIKGQDTEPERAVRSVLHKMGYRFRLHQVKLPGKPDIALAKYRLAIFVHGCFWHRHGCLYTYTPKSRVGFWQKKFQENFNRDLSNQRALKKLGWRVVVLWECEVKNQKALAKTLSRVMAKHLPGKTVRFRVGRKERFDE